MIYIFLVVLGLVLGSFINATVWRVYKQSRSKASKKDQRLSVLYGRSMCENCKHTLSVVDLVPVASWIFLRGKCRYCQKNISWQHPGSELMLGLLFVISYIVWSLPLVQITEVLLFTVWLLLVTLGFGLALYDLRWMILPNKLVYPFTAVALVYLGIYATVTQRYPDITSGLLGSVAFSGFFYLLYQFSRGKWIGGGDVRLALGLGLVLGWQKSILALTGAAYLGTLVIVVLMIAKKYHRKMKLPFGPFLLSATFLSALFGQQIINWYLRISGL